MALYLPLTRSETMIILMGGVLILAAELLNTGIERVVDIADSTRSDQARDAKDMASAGVALSAIAVGVAWVVVLVG